MWPSWGLGAEVTVTAGVPRAAGQGKPGEVQVCVAGELEDPPIRVQKKNRLDQIPWVCWCPPEMAFPEIQV